MVEEQSAEFPTLPVKSLNNNFSSEFLQSNFGFVFTFLRSPSNLVTGFILK
jgi:hypothetical protein